MGGAFSVNTAKAAKPRVEHGATMFWVSGIDKLDGATVRQKLFGVGNLRLVQALISFSSLKAPPLPGRGWGWGL